MYRPREELNQELLVKWIEVLESGKYECCHPHNRTFRCNEDNKKYAQYSAIGVLLQIVDPKGWVSGNRWCISSDLHSKEQMNMLFVDGIPNSVYQEVLLCQYDTIYCYDTDSMQPTYRKTIDYLKTLVK